MVLHALLGRAHRIENHAVPAFSSADAARYYLRVQARRRWDTVVVYLGNTDGAQSPHKGAYRRWRDIRKPRRNRGDRRSVIRIRPPEQAVFDEGQESPTVATTPREFGRNIESIVRAARHRRTRIVLINPVANHRFPAALMGSNAPFYRFVGLDNSWSGTLKANGTPSDLLIEAIGAHERGEAATALDRYRRLMDRPSRAATIATNNLAVLLDEQHGGDRPLTMLRQLAGADGASGAVAAFNLSRMLDRRGRHEEAFEYAQLAVERDSNLYRAKSAYRQHITHLSAYDHVDVIDLAQVLAPGDFVDYCHPTAEGHRAIAEAINERLPGGPRSGSERDAGYHCVHPNTDAFFDIGRTMTDRFAIDTRAEGGDVQRATAVMVDGAREPEGPGAAAATPEWPVPESDVQANVVHTLRFAFRHPMITSLADVRRAPPVHGWETGRFPEFYLYRLLHGYAAMAEARRLDGLPDAAGSHWQLAPDIHRERILPDLPFDRVAEPAPDVAYCRRVLDRVRHHLAGHPALFEDTRAERIARVKFWYLREGFRYGTHSRRSMLYPLWELEQAVEALYVCVLAARALPDAAAEKTALSLLEKMDRLRGVHERYADYDLLNMCGPERAAYRAELAGARKEFASDLRVA
ncbi:hypothetical protein [Streptomyces sclerotialus]|uniref:hypothetical protein n=1 Tax=Streptomyces sclerotialus TaxID=1957 RepID=UPI0018CB1CC6